MNLKVESMRGQEGDGHIVSGEAIYGLAQADMSTEFSDSRIIRNARWFDWAMIVKAAQLVTRVVYDKGSNRVCV